MTGSFQRQADAYEILSLKNQLHSNTPIDLLHQAHTVNLHPAVYLFAKDLLQKNEQDRACFYLDWLIHRKLESPLHHFVHYRHRLHCNSIAFTIDEIENFPDWLKEPILRDAVSIASNQNQPHLKLALVEFEHTQQQKLDLIDSVLKDFPDHSDAIGLKETVAPRFLKKPAPDQLFSVARDYEYMREFDQARKFFEKVIQSPTTDPELKVQSFERIAQTYKVQRNREVYWRELDKLADRLYSLAIESHFPLAEQAYIDNRITKARALWTAHQRSPGQAILISIQDHSFSNENQKAQINFILGSMEHEQGNFTQAINYFKIGLSYDVSDTRILENLLWAYAWNLFQNKQYVTAADVLEEAFHRLPEINFQSKVLYWKAVSTDRMRKTKKAQKYFNQVIDLNPLSYYGFLAHHQLNKTLKPIRPAKVAKTFESDLDWIYFFSETLAAQNYLKIFSANLDSQPQQTLRMLHQAELYDQAIFRYNRISRQLEAKDILALVPYGFPRPYLEYFNQFTNQFDFPLEISLALTRQESAFDRYARSWADAFGLMQLIPERAAEVAKRNGISLSSNDELYDPELNIRLGVFHLSELKKRFNHQFPFYVAAYNAGEGPVLGWQKNRFDGDIIEFIENIPYRETQNYVKLIFRNAAFYRMLLADEPFKIRDLKLIE